MGTAIQEAPTEGVEASADTATQRAADEADLLSGYGSDSTAPAPTSEGQEQMPDTNARREAAPSEDSANQTGATVEPEPDYVQVRREDYDRIMKAVNGMDQRFGATFGKVGELEQRVRDLQKHAGAGKPISLTADDFQEMRAEFPELAEMSQKAMERVLSRIGGGLATGQALTAEDLNAEVERRITAERIQAHETRRAEAIEALDERQPEWRQIVGMRQKDSDPVPDTAYRRWLATQAPEYQERMARAMHPDVILSSIERFQKQTAKPPAPKPKPTTSSPQAIRLAQAVTPKGAGALGKAPMTEEDEMMAGYHGK